MVAIISNPLPPKIKTGTYTGNGNATQEITGVGFQPDFLGLFAHVDMDNTNWFKTAAMGVNAKESGGTPYGADVIISLDADGFTVGDGSGNVMNFNARVYSYIALKNNPGM